MRLAAHLVLAAALVLGAPAQADTGNGSSGSAAISGDGRFVAFVSDASDLVPGDTNGTYDAFVRDRVARTTERVSVATGGAQGNGQSGVAAITPDGRFVLFTSEATNLVAGDTNDMEDVFLRDRRAGTTERVSLGTSGLQPNDVSPQADISASGQVVAFASNATNLAPGATTPVFRVYVRDRGTGTTELVGTGWMPALSADGRFVAWDAGDRILVRDRVPGTTEEASVATDGTPLPGLGAAASISADGRYVAFVMNELNGRDRRSTVYVRDRLQHATVSFGVDPGSGNPGISADGRFVAYQSGGVWIRELATGKAELASVSRSGASAGDSSYTGPGPISADGRVVAFSSLATNLAAGDANHTFDVFVRDRSAGMTELVSVARTPALVAGALTVHPARSGKTFVVTLAVSGPAAATVRCTASVRGRALHGAATYRPGVARCEWRLPARLHGALIRGSIGVTSPDGKVVRWFGARAR